MYCFPHYGPFLWPNQRVLGWTGLKHLDFEKKEKSSTYLHRHFSPMTMYTNFCPKQTGTSWKLMLHLFWPLLTWRCCLILSAGRWKENPIFSTQPNSASCCSGSCVSVSLLCFNKVSLVVKVMPSERSLFHLLHNHFIIMFLLCRPCLTC